MQTAALGFEQDSVGEYVVATDDTRRVLGQSEQRSRRLAIRLRETLST